MYRYERNWSSRAQNNLLWRFVKLLYTQLTLQYLGAAFMVGSWLHICMSHCICGHARYASCCASLGNYRSTVFYALQVLQFNSAFAVWRSVHFYGHLAIAGAPFAPDGFKSTFSGFMLHLGFRCG